jgi:dTDP-4-dehydrorhamnose reductase
MRLLITGAGGLLGSNLMMMCSTLDNVEAFGVYHRRLLRSPGLATIKADLTDQFRTISVVREARPDWVAHCAALTNVDFCEENKGQAFKANEEMTRNVAQAAREVGARVLYVSTDSVFDGLTGSYTEEDRPAPINVYAAAKLAGEVAIRESAGRHVIIRTNLYGWHPHGKLGLIEWIIERLERGMSVPGFSDVVFSPLLVNDLCRLMLEIMERELYGLYHVGASEACSKFDFAVATAEVFDLDRSLVHCDSVENSSLKAPRPKNTSLISDKISAALGAPMPKVKDGLNRLKRLRLSGFAERLKSTSGGTSA